jgi:hypothetical protein
MQENIFIRAKEYKWEIIANVHDEWNKDSFTFTKSPFP